MTKEQIISKNNKIVSRTTFMTLFVNVLLAVGKLLGGIFGFSKALISDSINSFGDIITSSICLIGAKAGSKKPDKKHPYGHERIQSISIVIFEMIVIFIALVMGTLSIISIVEHSTVEFPDLLSLIVASICIAAKLGLFINALILYKKTKSSILKAQMFDHLLDSIGTFISLIVIVIAMKLKIDWIDGAASIVIYALIIATAVKVLIENISNLIDESWSHDKEEEIKKIILSHEQVKKIDLIRTRKFGDYVYVDVELSMPKEMSLLESHELADHLELEIENEYIEVIHVGIHVNPY